jgi:uncharacterized caspase-like protein/cyclophilin family peptidyl-prolyl cis-trans isomerase
MGKPYLALSTVAAVIFTLFINAASAHAERRVALVIGNSDYRNTHRLTNTRNDAQDVAAALKRIGFDTIVGIDLEQAGMQDAAIRFARAARDADVALFYYAGHAMQFAGVNYLVPIDASLRDEADLRRMTRVDEIVADLQQAKNLRILVLDSCRNNPLVEALTRSIGRTRAALLQRGLAKIASPEGMIIAYATQAGQEAEDGSGRNSPYTNAFLKHIETPAEIGTVFRRISADVYAATQRTQLPELSLSMIGEFYLTIQPADTTSPRDRAAQVWAVTKDTASIAVLESFIRQFAGTEYGTMARARIEELKKSQMAAVAPATTPTAPPSSVQPAVGLYAEPTAPTKAGNLANPAALNEQAPAAYKVKFDTSKGAFLVDVRRDWAPNGADRFYNLVKNGYYDNVRFFRVIFSFMAQFGIHGDPSVSAVWREARIKDDPVKQSNKRGFITYATAGPDTRTTQVFINFADNAALDRQGFAPFGQVSSAGMNVVDALNAEYGEGAPNGRGPNQARMQREGNAYLQKEFPKLDFVKKATIEK